MPKDALKIKRHKTEINITFTAIIKKKEDLFNEDGHIDEPSILDIFKTLNNGDQIHFEVIKKS